MGGLGSPAALYLASAGIGHLVLSDFDRVELSNLQRQVIHRESAIDEPKALSAKQTIAELNSDVEVTAGVLAEACGQLLSGFFQRRRMEKKTS